MWEVVTNTQMGEADRLTIASGTPGIVLMENAGRAVADVVCRRQPPGSRIVIVAGPGNNGGDGFVAARHLAARGRHVTVLMVGDRARLKGDAATAATAWAGRTEPATPEGLAGAHLIVDALFGAGLDRPVEGLAHTMIEAINASGMPVVAVDLASGVNGTTGAVMGLAVRVDMSVTFFRKKIGHVLLPGRTYCGEVHVVDIGIKADTLAVIGPRVAENHPSLWRARLPVPQVAGHKYGRGHAVVVSGGSVTTGAARLAARGALRGGAGLATIAAPRDAMAVHAAANLAVMVRPVDGHDELARFLSDKRFNAVALGPGLGVGTTTCDLVAAALAGPRMVVLDADALTSFADHSENLWGMIKGRDAGVVLTPHDGEFARLFNDIAASSESKLEKARQAAARSGAICVLKGADTMVAAPDGRAVINAHAPPWLATAGSGDVLTGIVLGLGAQGMPAFDAACAGVWMHGDAGRVAGAGLIAEDLPEALPEVWRDLVADNSVEA
jgi:hydroxyethylthiazole kinase-like uncharacterized protein yjeF